MMKKWGTILLCFALAACEKTITITTGQQTPKLVVEAQIETGLAPVVVLSRSLDYFSTIDYITLNNTYVHGAKVTISEGANNYILHEDSVVFDIVYMLYFYTTSPFILKGDPGKQYDLKIETGGQVYTSTTTIPLLTKKIDSLWWKQAPNNPDTTKTVLMARITDPPGFGNYIRYFTKTNSNDFLPGENSVFDDQVIDGKTYDIQVDQGTNKNFKLSGDTYGYFKRGDTATVKFCNIDQASFNFWRTWEFSFRSTGNPFSSPGKVLGNISNGGLGSFCGYAPQYKTLIIPK